MKNKKNRKITSIMATSVIVANNIMPVTVMADEINKENIIIEQRNTEIKDFGVLGTPKYIDNNVSFPSASYDEGVNGFQLKLGESIPIKYVLDGKNKFSSNGLISSTKRFTSQEFTDFLKSIEIELNSNKSLNIELKVGEEQEGYIYLESNGHYYKRVEKEDVKYQDALDLPKTHELYGVKGNMPIIKSEEEKELIKSLKQGKTVYISGTDLTKEDSWVYDSEPEEGKELELVNEYFVEIGNSEVIGSIVAKGSIEKYEDEQLPVDENKDKVKPIINGVENKTIYIGESINLLEGITVSDNIDKVTTNDINIKIYEGHDPITESSILVDNIDTNKEGKYTVVYILEDSSSNRAEKSMMVTVDTKSQISDIKEVNSIDISKGLSNAIVTSNRGYIIGFKVEGISNKPIKYTYTLNGEEVTNTNKVLNFYDKYSVKEIQDILRSLKVESDSNVDLTVTLGNLEKDMTYIEENNHYYQLKDARDWGVGEELANNSSYLGHNGSIGSLKTKEIDVAVTNQLKLNNSRWIAIGAKYENGKIIWVDGEEVTYNNFNQSYRYPNSSNSHVYARNSEWSGWAKNSGGDKVLVEYGKVGEKLPRPTVNSSDSIVVKGTDRLALGEHKIINGVVTFPNAQALIVDRANLQINLFEGYVGNEINYTLNKTKRSHIAPEIEVKGIDNAQLSEILKTLSFKIDYGQNLGIQVVLTDNEGNKLYEGVSVENGTNEGVMNAIDGDLSTSWSESTKNGIATYVFDSAKSINTVEAIHHSDSKSKGNSYIVEGLIGGVWKEIGKQTVDYLDLLEQQMVVRIDVEDGTYEGIRVKVNNTSANVNVYDIKFNGEPKKKVSSKEIKEVSMEKDTQAPVITVSHTDMVIEKGSSIPKITASATDNDYQETNLTSKIVTTIISPNGQEVDAIDNMVIGDWIVKFEVEDRSGNKAKEEVRVTVTEDMTKPILIGVRGGVIKQGEPYNLRSHVKAEDNMDKDITNRIVITYTDPSGIVQPTIDDSVKGYWKVKYSVSDSANNVTEEVTNSYK